MLVWEFLDYREYLISRLGPEGSRTGSRKQLAEAIKVHTTFISQVLKERAELSLEQAELVNSFFGHTENEGEYFILLILKNRAGSEKLKMRFDLKIQAMRDERLNIKNRLDVSSEISQKDRERFYSSYVYGAIHVLTAISKFKTVEALTEVLKLQRSQVQEIVEFMLRIGVLKEDKVQLSPGSKHVHLGTDSELILKHHTNWRLHTVSNLQFLNRDDIHYSAALSLSQKDAFKVKDSILQNLKSNMDIISASPEEVAYVMNFDFYKLT